VVTLVCGLVLLAFPLAGCGARPSGEPDGGPVTWPSATGSTEVAFYHVFGGFVPSGWRFIDAPDVVVYSDGRAVVGARRVLRLSPDELSDLVRGLRGELNGLGPTEQSRASQQVMDAPTTTLRVRKADGSLQAVQAYALSEAGGYDERLVAAQQRMRALAERADRTGEAYTSDRIRIVAEKRGADASARPWPEGVTLPPPAADGSDVIRTGNLTGAEAAAVVRDLGPVPPTGAWPTLRAPDGTVYAVAWRYLLPDE